MTIEYVEWRDIKPGDILVDESRGQEDKVTGLHAIQEGVDGYELSLNSDFSESITVSGDHLLKVKIKQIGDKGLVPGKNYKIPAALGEILEKQKTYGSAEYHVFSTEELTEKEILERVNHGPALERVLVRYKDEEEPLPAGEFWVPASVIYYSSQFGVKFRNEEGKPIYSRYVDQIDARCVTTESHEYSTYGLTSHNSVTIRNVFFHVIQHGDFIKIAGIDLKITEFNQWQGHKNVVGIANDTATALELLRIGREIMKTRNKQMAPYGITDFADFVPQHRDGWEYISGIRYKSRDMIEVEVNGKQTEMPAAEVVDMLLNS